MSRLLILISIAFVMVSAAVVWMLRVYLPGAPLTYVFFEMTPVLTLLEIVIVAMTGVGVFGALERNVVRVRTAAIVTVTSGVFGTGYGELTTHFGTLYDSWVTFATMAPGRIESLAILALGLFGAVLTMSILQVRGGVRRA